MSNVTLENYKKVQEDITGLKSDLNDIRVNKEKWFKKKEELKVKLNSQIAKIKEINGMNKAT